MDARCAESRRLTLSLRARNKGQRPPELRGSASLYVNLKTSPIHVDEFVP